MLNPACSKGSHFHLLVSCWPCDWNGRLEIATAPQTKRGGPAIAQAVARQVQGSKQAWRGTGLAAWNWPGTGLEQLAWNCWAGSTNWPGTGVALAWNWPGRLHELAA